MELAQCHTTVPEHHDAFLSDHQGQAPLQLAGILGPAIALSDGSLKMKKLTQPSQGRLKLGKLKAVCFASSRFVISLLLLPVCAPFPHRQEERETTNVRGNRMSLRRTALLGDWRRKGRLQVCHLHKMPSLLGLPPSSPLEGAAGTCVSAGQLNCPPPPQLPCRPQV